jgi:hypothetical protein
MHANFGYSSCPRLSRASTPFGCSKKEDVDGRDKPGHDDLAKAYPTDH